jgi:hypothetical protein
MKTIALTLLIAVFGATAVQAQSTEYEKATECDKKVLKKIKRKMAMVDFREHVALDKQAKIIVTCVINDDKTVRIADVRGRNEKLNQAIIENLEEHPIKCEKAEPGKQFSFVLTFRHIPKKYEL